MWSNFVYKKLSSIKYDLTVYYTVSLVFQINCTEAAKWMKNKLNCNNRWFYIINYLADFH